MEGRFVAVLTMGVVVVTVASAQQYGRKEISVSPGVIRIADVAIFVHFFLLWFTSMSEDSLVVPRFGSFFPYPAGNSAAAPVLYGETKNVAVW